MQYLGGKSKWGKAIVETIEPWRPSGALFVDVFCGTLNVVRHARPPRLALDLCEPLVSTLRAAIRGWVPPENVTEDLYQRIKADPIPWDPMTGFAMFGCSYGGQWGGAFAKSKGKKEPGGWQYPEGVSFARIARDSLVKKAADCRDLNVLCRDYRQIPVPPPGTVLYCDIPYRGTSQYAAVPPFDHDVFWRWGAAMSLAGALVFVSEGDQAQPPPGWLIMRQWQKEGRLGSPERGQSKTRTERLYVHWSSPMVAKCTK